MTTAQLALCDPTWIDPQPDDEDDVPWCSYLDLDLGGQGVSAYRLATMTTLTVSREYL